MNKCDLSLTLDREDRQYAAGDRIRGTVRVQVRETSECRKLALSLEWYTSGRGNSEMGRHEVRGLFGGRWMAGQNYSYPFEMEAPAGPFSYRGRIVSVNWRLVARADVPWGLDPKVEAAIRVVPGGGRRDVNFGSAYQRPEERRKLQQRVRTVFKGIGWACIATGLFMILVAFLTSFPGRAGSTGLIWFLFGLCDLIAGGAFVFFATRKRLAERKLGGIEVKVVPAVVNRGGSIDCVIRFCPRETIELDRVTARLTGEERAVDGSGDSQTTHRHVLCDDEIVLGPGRAVRGGERVLLTSQLSVPADAAPTFAAPSNSIHWKVTVRVAVRQWPDWVEDFPVTVRP